MEKVLMGGIVGFVLLTLISYIFIVLHVTFLIIPVFLALIAIAVVEIKKVKLNFNLQTLIIFVVFTIGIAGQLAIISPSGTIQNGDLVFWSANGHDGAWHIALMEEMKKGYPFQNPVLAGEKLVNYHFFSDVLPAMASKYLPFSNLDLYFRIFPFFYSLFLGTSVYFLTKRLTNNFSASIWATIFTYFAGSFGFIVTYLKNKSIGGESIFWATQPQSSSGNPPQIVSNFLVLTALYFLITFLQKKGGKITFFVCILLFGTLSAFKIYAGVVFLIALGIAGVWQLVKARSPQILFLTLASGLLAALLYFPNVSGSTSFLIFEPWWYIRTMVVEPSRLNWIDLELKRQFYLARGGVRSFLRIVEYEGIAFLIFFFGNLGMRCVGLWEIVKKFKNILNEYFNIVFISTIILSLILPLLFLQKGVASNTSQFLQYFVLLFGILAGITTSQITSKFKLLIPIILIIMIPTQAGLLLEFYGTPQHPRQAFAKITKSELEALNFVKTNTKASDVILTPPYNQYLNLDDSIPNIWDWFDTSYVAAFTSRRTYMDDYEQVDIMGYDYKPRLEVKKVVFESEKSNEVKAAISKAGVNLIYFSKPIAPKVNLETLGFTKIFENQEIEIWKIS